MIRGELPTIKRQQKEDGAPNEPDVATTTKLTYNAANDTDSIRAILWGSETKGIRTRTSGR